MMKIIHEFLIEAKDDDELGQLLTWGTLTLNAHFTNFLLANDDDVLRLLNEFSATVNSLESNIHTVTTLLPITKLIMERKDNQSPCTSSAYCIEIVNL